MPSSSAAIFLAYFNEACIIISAILMAFGWKFIRQKKIETHRRFMLSGSIFAALFFLTYAAKTVFIGDNTFGGPKSADPYYYSFLQAHSILATIAAILGIITLTYAFRQKFSTHRKIGPWTVVIWFITAATGLTVFILLFVAYQPGPATGLWHAWVG